MRVGPGANPPPGYGGWGGGQGPTGLSNAPGVSTKPGWITRNINNAFYVIIPASGLVRSPHMTVPPGAAVNVRAHNGTNAGNANVVRISSQPELLGTIDGDPITPDSEIVWPCDTTGEIWVAGTAGDGIRVSIQANRL